MICRWNTLEAEDDARKAGSANEAAERIPRPASPNGREALIHCFMFNFTLPIW